jgi:hypothetical protein
MSKKKGSTDMPDELPKGEVLFYQTKGGRVKLDVRLEDETVWLTQPLMAELFQSRANHQLPNMGLTAWLSWCSSF